MDHLSVAGIDVFALSAAELATSRSLPSRIFRRYANSRTKRSSILVCEISKATAKAIVALGLDLSTFPLPSSGVLVLIAPS